MSRPRAEQDRSDGRCGRDALQMASAIPETAAGMRRAVREEARRASSRAVFMPHLSGHHFEQSIAIAVIQFVCSIYSNIIVILCIPQTEMPATGC